MQTFPNDLRAELIPRGSANSAAVRRNSVGRIEWIGPSSRIFAFRDPRRHAAARLPVASVAAHKLGERFLPIGMPTRESWSILDDVAGSPGDPLLVHRAGGFVVGAQKIEVAGGDMIEHEIDYLLGRPRAGRLLTRPCQAGEGE